MTRTGVFFNLMFSGPEWHVIGNKFARFPQVMASELALPGVTWFRSPAVSEELLLRIHTPRFLEDLRRAWYYEGALYSVGGCVAAAAMMAGGELTNALVFTTAAGHHAERDSAWGGTYASCAGPAVWNARHRFGPLRVAILDTDRHHGNGTRDVFRGDPDVLHVCFCNSTRAEDRGTKVCVDTGWSSSDDAYLALVRREFMPRVERFRPDMILHNLGHDTCQGDYGDLGLSVDFFPQLVQDITSCAEAVCGGRYLVLTHGGNRADVAEIIFPQIIRVLAADYEEGRDRGGNVRPGG